MSNKKQELSYTYRYQKDSDIASIMAYLEAQKLPKGNAIELSLLSLFFPLVKAMSGGTIEEVEHSIQISLNNFVTYIQLARTRCKSTFRSDLTTMFDSSLPNIDSATSNDEYLNFENEEL